MKKIPLVTLVWALVATHGAAFSLPTLILGADPSGRQDSTSAIQKAIDAAPANTTLAFTPGTYKYSALRISGKTGLTLTGTATLQESSNQAAMVTVTNSPGLILDTGLTFDAHGHNGYILDITSNNVTIHSTFINLGDGTTPAIEVGIYVAPTSNDLVVSGAAFKNFRGSGSAAVRGVYLCNYRNASLASVRANIENSNFSQFSTNTGGNADGVVIDQQGLSSFAQISGNTFSNVETRAVKLMSNDNMVSGNQITETNVGVQAFSAVSSYGDRNTISNNNAQASGCVSGCSFYLGWDLNGSGIILSGNTLTNPANSTDNPHNCVGINIAVSTTGDTVFNDIQLTGNTCQNFTYVKVYPNTPLANFTMANNTFRGAVYHVVLQFYSGASIDSFAGVYGNTMDAGDVLMAFDN